MSSTGIPFFVAVLCMCSTLFLKLINDSMSYPVLVLFFPRQVNLLNSLRSRSLTAPGGLVTTAAGEAGTTKH